MPLTIIDFKLTGKVWFKASVNRLKNTWISIIVNQEMLNGYWENISFGLKYISNQDIKKYLEDFMFNILIYGFLKILKIIYRNQYKESWIYICFSQNLNWL